MEVWLTPTGILVVIAIGGVFWAAASWYGSVNSDRSSFKEFMNEVRDDIKKILQRLPAPTVASSSPMTLTDFGKEIAEELGAKTWAEGLAPNVLEEIKGKRPFEVDEFAEDYVQKELTKDWQDNVAASAYRRGLKREHVLNVLRVVLRDELLRIGNFSGPGDRPRASESG